MQEDNLFSVHLEGLQRPVSVGLLTGSVRAPVKRMLTAMAGDGTLDLVIGTQALIQEGVSIPALALAVADEQHRFGVAQRTALRERGGENPHTLIMSATPIPRTLTMTLYGDLDISTIDELPAGRQQVRTKWVAENRRADAYQFVRDQVSEERQAFVVCPLIDESSSIESRAATEEYERLSKEVFPDLRVGLLHGRMHSRDKDKILRSFSDGDLDVLVTTAVVEVGIDVPNASVMVIEGAERFGLAQLHQFRGAGGPRPTPQLLPPAFVGDAEQRCQGAPVGPGAYPRWVRAGRDRPGASRSRRLLRHPPERPAIAENGAILRPEVAGVG